MVSTGPDRNETILLQHPFEAWSQIGIQTKRRFKRRFSLGGAVLLKSLQTKPPKEFLR
jgi:hypothetical protein